MILRDVRHALRLFVREPAFTLAAVLTLALGIGANTALFAVVEAVLLRPMPFVDDRGVMLRHRDVRTGIVKENVALGDVIDFRARQQSLEMLVAYNGVQGTLFGDGDPLRIRGVSATPELFRALRVEPLMGRFFEPGDVSQGAPEIVVISHALWNTHFGSDPNIIGRAILINTTRRTVVGVAPRGFRFPPAVDTDVILPLRLPPAAPQQRRAWILAMGRLRDGVTLEQANAEFAALSRQFEIEFPATNAGTQYDVLSTRDATVGETKRPLLLLLGAVGFVLLISCANVGNLLIARSLARRQELTMRLALGAGRARLAIQMLVEGVVLAVAGGLVGVTVAWFAAPALASLVPQTRPIPGLTDVAINMPVLAFSVVMSIAAALLFSGLAAVGLTGSTADVTSARRTTMSAGARRAASGLVAIEVALAVVLLLGAGLTLRSFANLIAVDPGFRPDRVVNVQIALPPGRYADPPARRAFYDRAFAAIAALPDVEEVGAGVVTPLTGNNWTIPLERPDRPLSADERAPEVGWQSASAGYFRALGIPLRAGRLFDDRDRPGTPTVVIVSDGLAQQYFPGEPAVGRRIKLGNGTAEIVGVVGNIRRAALSELPRADMYLPFEQAVPGTVGLFIRAGGDPLSVLPSVQQAVRAIEPNAALFEAEPMAQVAADSAAVARLAMRLLAGFAVVALALAAIGIYGVMSYSVRRRTRELGTRLALGAHPRSIVALVMRQAAVVAAIGLGAGLLFGLAAARSLSAILYGVPTWDPITLAAAIGILSLTALGAGYLPARRAARIDPARTLAAE